MQKFECEENEGGSYVFGELDDGFFIFAKGKNCFDIKAFYLKTARIPLRL